VAPEPSAKDKGKSSPALPQVKMPPIPRDLPSPEPELQPPQTSKSPGRRKFNLKPILKRKGSNNKKAAEPLVQPVAERVETKTRTTMSAYAMDPLDPKVQRALRSKSHSPGRRRQNSDIHGAPRNSNLAKKFSRLMRVYDNE